MKDKEIKALTLMIITLFLDAIFPFLPERGQEWVGIIVHFVLIGLFIYAILLYKRIPAKEVRSKTWFHFLIVLNIIVIVLMSLLILLGMAVSGAQFG